MSGTLSLAVYNAAGRRIHSESEIMLYAGHFEQRLSLPHAPSGVYFLRARLSGQNIVYNTTQKILLLK